MRNLKQKQFGIKINSVDQEQGIIEGTFSNAMIDRHGEVVDQKSWVLSEYLLNPVILFAHDHYQPAIGKAIELGLDADGNLSGKIQFAINEYDFAKTIFNLYAGGYMSAFSVGFESLEPTFDTENEMVVLRKNVLYEISAVNVPANALALAKTKGIDTKPVEDYFAKHKAYMDEQKDNIEKLKNTLIKEGRVLSKKNREVIETAVSALQEVLNADGAEKSNSIGTPRTNKLQQKSKVVTPQVAVGGKKYPIWAVNKAIRHLLQSKTKVIK
jgi:HK97 family phage prohead protease